jgi:hypothetical protein
MLFIHGNMISCRWRILSKPFLRPQPLLIKMKISIISDISDKDREISCEESPVFVCNNFVPSVWVRLQELDFQPTSPT